MGDFPLVPRGQTITHHFFPATRGPSFFSARCFLNAPFRPQSLSISSFRDPMTLPDYHPRAALFLTLLAPCSNTRFSTALFEANRLSFASTKPP